MKKQFGLDPELVFLNHGSFGACPLPVLEAQVRWQREMERNPVAFLSRRSAGLLAEARAALGARLGAEPGNLVFLGNASAGVNTVARSLRLQRGDEVLATDHEYGACDNTWRRVCAAAGAAYRRVPVPLPFHAAEFTARIWSQVSESTRVLFLSHVTSTTALILPVAELCRRARAAGILTVIDGAHAPGQIPLELEALGADFYTGNCHKWLCAPKGSAFLHARPEQHAGLDALVTSWGYSPDVEDGGHDLYAGLSVLERHQQWQGTRDLSAFLSVPAALRFQDEHDWDAQRRRCHALAFQAQERICALTGLQPVCGDGDFGQMLAIPMPALDPAILQRTLFEKHGIEIPVTRHGERIFLRISVQAYNGPEDIDALLAAVAGILAGRP